ncbi:hypothetical protein BdWA1_000771 [Babesia duncani]|uniref:Uncharacterized protein n=1 Tax=Babesia duncani TaxID=323732 RepID=A0AAD9UQ40_9APIC|nr:hypothetical protein BdWA1_000771 [Babesia duncani]
MLDSFINTRILETKMESPKLTAHTNLQSYYWVFINIGIGESIIFHWIRSSQIATALSDSSWKDVNFPTH